MSSRTPYLRLPSLISSTTRKASHLSVMVLSIIIPYLAYQGRVQLSGGYVPLAFCSLNITPFRFRGCFTGLWCVLIIGAAGGHSRFDIGSIQDVRSNAIWPLFVVDVCFCTSPFCKYNRQSLSLFCPGSCTLSNLKIFHIDISPSSFFQFLWRPLTFILFCCFQFGLILSFWPRSLAPFRCASTILVVFVMRAAIVHFVVKALRWRALAKGLMLIAAILICSRRHRHRFRLQRIWFLRHSKWPSVSIGFVL